MQDEYVKAFEKIKMSDERKNEMRKALEMELASNRKPAKRTHLSGGAKAGIAAAAVAVTLAGVFCVPTTRNAIFAGVKDIFSKEVPEGAVDELEVEKRGREERVIPTDVPEASEILEAVAQQDLEQDKFFEDVTVTADYYSDPELNELANFYANQGYTLMDLAKDAEYYYEFPGVQNEEWFSDGFKLAYQIGDNAYGYMGYTTVFKATEEQMNNLLNNDLSYINYERTEHRQETVTFEDFWTQGTDEEGNITYSASWEGPEPEIKICDSDRARFITYDITYDPVSQIAICIETNGGGVG